MKKLLVLFLLISSTAMAQPGVKVVINGGQGSFGGTGLSQLGTSPYGLIKVNDSTYRVDTFFLSSRLNRQKAVDSLVALIALKFNTADTANKWVNLITRTPGKDSVIFYIGATRYAIKDSVGGSSQTWQQALTTGSTLTGNNTIAGGANTIAFNNARLTVAKGANVAAANDLTLGTDGNSFTITGSTTINAITTANWQTGSVFYLHFTGTPIVKHNTFGSGGTAKILLAGAVDYTAAIEDVLTLFYDGTYWHETARMLAVTGSSFNIYNSNGTLSGNRTITGNQRALTIDNTIAFFVDAKNSSFVNRSYFQLSADGIAANIFSLRSGSNSSNISVVPDSISIYANQGIVSIDTLAQAANMTNKRVMLWDEVTKRWERIVKDSVAGSSGVTSVTGTTNRITSTGGTTPVIDISSAYVGQATITTLGTIGTGVWNGTDVAYANIAQLPTVTLAGNSTGGTADIQAITLGSGLSFVSTVLTPADNSASNELQTWQQTLTTGSTLTGNNTIAGGGFTFAFTGSIAGSVFQSSNSNTSISSYAIRGNATGNGGSAILGIVSSGSGNALTGSALTGAGVSAGASSGTGVSSQVDDGLPYYGIATPTTTNTIHNLMGLYRYTTGTAANGIGGSIKFVTQTTTSFATSTELISKLTDATNATATSAFIIRGVGNGTERDIVTVTAASASTGSFTSFAGQYYSTAFALTDAATVAVNWNNGNVQYVTLGGNRTITFSNPKEGAKYELLVVQDGTGSRVPSVPTVKWEGNTAGVFTTTANRADKLTLDYINGSYYATLKKDFN